MNSENTRRIIEACPSLFDTMKEECDNMTNGVTFSPIAFFFECGDGWADLLVELCEKIQSHLVTLSPESVYDIVALQVKEKYGSLRFYISSYDEVIECLIDEYSRKSRYVCETCGKPGKIRGSVWLYAACNDHTKDGDHDTTTEPNVP
jgi:hypothetical protein